MSGVRSFVAVPLPGELQARIFAVTGDLGHELPDVRWLRKVENLHVTVKFLGKVEETQLDALAAALGEALGTLPRFAIEVRGMGAFPSARKANVVWVGVDDVQPEGAGMAAVAETVEAVAETFGFSREQRPFRAHVTLGRCKGRGIDALRALQPLADQAFGSASVDEVHIYESRLGGEGSTYVLRSRAALGN
jgi:RNA 2',3'-cyclic 3'-phosphodiesterase